ncbi:MAG: glycosyltransferase family 4 protein [Acidobacteriota bacterium]
MMRILVLSQYYRPEPIAKPPELAEALQGRGHRVSALTSFPNYPSGKLHSGYRLKLMQREVIAGIPVLRALTFPYHGRRASGRILNYASFALFATLVGFVAPPCDIIYVWHPPLTIGIAAWLVARFRRVPFVYDVQDIWPESVTLSGVVRPGSWLLSTMSALERFVYARADHLIVVTEGARQNLITKGVPATKVSVLPHWVDDRLFDAVGREQVRLVRETYAWGSRFVALFAGNIGLLQGLETLVRAAAELPPDAGVLLVLVGDGTDKSRLEKLAIEIGATDRVQFIEQQPPDRMPALMAAADVLLVHLKRSAMSHHVIPTKTLAYMAAGKPLLMAMEGAAADLARASGAGTPVPPEEPGALARAMLALRSMDAGEREAMGSRGREYVRVHLSRDKVVPQYEALFQRMVDARADRSSSRHP